MEGARGYQRWITIGLLFIGLTVFSVKFYDRYLFLRTVVLSFSLGLFIALRGLKKVQVTFFTIILFLLFLLEIISAFWSYSISNTIKYSYLALLTFLIFLVFNQEDQKSNLWFLLRLNAMLLMVYLAAATYQVISKGWEPYGIHSLSSHKNLFAGFLMLSLPLTLIAIKFCQKGGMNVLLKALLILTLLFIVILQTRSVYLSMLIFFLVAMVFGVRYFLCSNNRKKIKVFLKQLVWIPAFLIPGVILYLLVIGPDTREDFMDKINVTNYFSQPGNRNISPVTENNYQSIEIRKIFWRSSLNLISDKPLFGTGRGNWKIAVGEYATPHLPDRLSDDNSYSHAHNDFLQQCSETGITGLLLFFIPVFVILGLGYKSLIFGKFSFEMMFLTVGLTAFLVFAFFDFPFQNVEHRVLFYFQLLLLYQLLVSDGTIASKRILSLNKAVLYIPIFAVCILSVIQLRSDFHALKAVQYEGEGNFRKAKEHLNKSRNRVYDITPTNFPLDYISGRIFIESGDLESAFPLVEASLRINPFEFRALNDYGMLLNSRGKPQEALEVFQKASNLAPYFEDPKFNMAAIYYLEKKYNKALEIVNTLNESSKKNDYIRQIIAEMNSEMKRIAD